ncbi:MAG: LysM peptidoglycan-binding domain-containing protein [Deltaproteobacteria bacterium]|nr:LysM peptidoglycan-binding domain-containing protein [Deltaproteobacteria bacterium]
MTRRSIVAFLIAVACLSIPFSQALSGTDILNIRRWTAPDHTRIVIDTSEKARYTVTEENHRLFIDLLNTSLPTTIPHQYVLNKPAVKKILLFPLSGEKIRIEIWLSENVKTKVFTLGKILNKPHRVVIDVLLPEIEKRESEERKQVKIQEKRKIIVIDPGHGGEDPGAIGRRGTKEKDIVLRIAKQLQNVLRRKGYQAYLTREGDYYVSFKKRLEIAREYGADLLVSIHTDAHRNRGARGSSVYCFSTGGASNEAVRILARNENLSDVIAGVANGQNNGESDPITLNMLQTETINQSKSFGGAMLQDLMKVNRIKYSKVQEAPFRVLKLPDIPSILIEVAYISNPREELLLRQSSFRKDLAWALASSIDEFLPLPPSVVAKANEGTYSSPPSDSYTSREKEQIYVVKRGDYLSRIADRYDTTVGTLLQYNELKRKNRIYRGQRLKIPPSSWSPRSLSIPTATYYVKRRDTIGKIADRYDATISTLLQLNNMEMRDRIYVGQKLEIPVAIDESGDTNGKDKKPSIHVVKRGDILDRIALRYNTTVTALMKLNNIKTKNRICVGQRLKVSPASGQSESRTPQKIETSSKVVRSNNPPLYRVKRGDTLGKIARRCNTTIGALLKLNNLRLENGIYVHQKLILPIENEQPDVSGEKISNDTPQIARNADSRETTDQKNNTADGSIRNGDDEKQKSSDEGKDQVSADSAGKKNSSIEETQCTTYIVRRGDNLDRIAEKYNTTPETLMEVNEIKSKNKIYVNQKVNIPTVPGTSVDDYEEKSMPFIYSVKRGDTLENIAFKHNITVASLLKLNNIKQKDRIYVNQTLKVPSSLEERNYVVYIVKKGDFLKKIAGRHNTTVIALRKLNNLENKNHICAGQRLKIPSDEIR